MFTKASLVKASLVKASLVKGALLVPILAAAQTAPLPAASEGAAGDALKIVSIQRIAVEGTRLPAPSVIRLAQLSVGDQVNFAKLRAALQKITMSGLVKSVNFEYESAPNEETNVILHLECVDETPLAKASIDLPGVDENDIWAWLAQLDPLFTRELPPNEAAIRLYSTNIGKYLETHGRPDFSERFAIAATGTNSNGGATPDRLVFKAVKRRAIR